MNNSFVVAAVVVALLAVQANGALLPSAGCSISKDARGSTTVTFTLSPSVDTVLAKRRGLKAPHAIFTFLNSKATNPAIAVANRIKNTFLNPFTKILHNVLPQATPPSCEFFWISNQLVCTHISSYKTLLDVLCSALGEITISPRFKLPISLGSTDALGCEEGGLWGLAKIGATPANAAGFSGQGVVVAGIDSGVRHTHEELKDSWRSEYGWYNGYDAKSKTPSDDHGHGTHTMGSIVGKTVGVAPGAKWIACKACDSSASCDNGPLMKCLQWAACPDGGKLNCTTAPKVINNSWGGGQGDVTFNGALKVLATMGIISVFSAGNSGMGGVCGTVVSPADEPQRPLSLLSIAATDCQDTLWYNSSAGPTMADDTLGELGITVSGPGVTILSSWTDSDTEKRNDTGTSMSAPYVAGAVAVLLSKNPNLTYDQVVSALTDGASRNPEVTTSAPCGGFNASQTEAYPNNYYGYGRIDLGTSLTLV